MLRAAIASLVALAVLACLPGCGDRAAGAAQPTSTVAYSVEGMHCSNCVEAITAKVKDVPGVVACDVSLDEKRMTVSLNDPAAGQRVADTVGRMGYTVTAR